MAPQTQRSPQEREEFQKIFAELARQLGVPPEVLPKVLERLDQTTGRFPPPPEPPSVGPDPNAPDPRYTPRFGGFGMGLGVNPAAMVAEQPGQKMAGSGTGATLVRDAVYGMFADPNKPLIPRFMIPNDGSFRLPTDRQLPQFPQGETSIGPVRPAGSGLHWSEMTPPPQWAGSPESYRALRETQRGYFQDPNDPEFGDPTAAGPRGFTPDFPQSVISAVERASQEVDRRMTPTHVPIAGERGGPTVDEILASLKSPGSTAMMDAFHQASAKHPLPGSPSPATAPPPPDPAQFESALSRVEQRMADAGFPIKRISSGRSAEQQNRLFQQGRSAPGPIVTDKDGYLKPSLHQSGSAADYWFVGKDGKVNAAETNPWALLGRIAKEEGLDWGGDWKGGPGSVGSDRAHLQVRTAPIGRPTVPTPATATATRASDGRAIARPRTGILGAMATDISVGQNGLDDLALLRDQLWNKVFGAKPTPGAPARPTTTTAGGPQFGPPLPDQFKSPQATVAEMAAPTMGVPVTSPSRGAVLNRPQNFEPPPAPTAPLVEGPAQVPVWQRQAVGATAGLRMTEPGRAVAEAPPALQAKVQQVASTIADQDVDEAQTQQAAPLPAWKRVLEQSLHALPDMLISYAAARYDRPDIADNWLKQKALKVEQATEAAKLAAANSKDDFDKMMKLLDLEQTRATSRVGLAKEMGGLHERVAKGELLDIPSYFAQMNLLANMYARFGGNYQDLIAAYPVPHIDQINTLRKQFNDWWKNVGYNEEALKTSPQEFRHPWTGQPLTGYEAVRILGLFDPTTNQPILDVGPVSEIRYTNAKGEDVIGAKSLGKMARTGTELTQTPPTTVSSAPTPSGELISVPFRGTTPGTPVITPGGAPNTTMATQMLRLEQFGIDHDLGEAAIALLRARGVVSPGDSQIQALIQSTDKLDSAELAKMKAMLAAVKNAPPPEAGKTDPYKWFRDMVGGAFGKRQ